MQPLRAGSKRAAYSSTATAPAAAAASSRPSLGAAPADNDCSDIMVAPPPKVRLPGLALAAMPVDETPPRVRDPW